MFEERVPGQIEMACEQPNSESISTSRSVPMAGEEYASFFLSGGALPQGRNSDSLAASRIPKHSALRWFRALECGIPRDRVSGHEW